MVSFASKVSLARPPIMSTFYIVRMLRSVSFVKDKPSLTVFDGNIDFGDLL